MNEKELDDLRVKATLKLDRYLDQSDKDLEKKLAEKNDPLTEFVRSCQ